MLQSGVHPPTEQIAKKDKEINEMKVKMSMLEMLILAQKKRIADMKTKMHEMEAILQEKDKLLGSSAAKAMENLKAKLDEQEKKLRSEFNARELKVH